jgi:pyridoxal-dependent decarboxylase-like protein
MTVDRGKLPDHAPEEREPFENIFRDGDDVIPPGDLPLAVAELVRLLPGKELRPLDPRRAALRRAGGAGDAVVDQPRLHELENGMGPCAVVATVGTTSSQAVDPVRAVGKLCRDHRMWLHVGAAMSGTAAVCPEFRWLHDGLELADRYCFNPGTSGCS